MKKQIILLAILISSAGLMAQSEKSFSIVDIDEYITDYMTSAHKPGLSACIIKYDSVVWRGNYGYANVADEKPVTKNTFFYAYSIGKSVTAACIMKLWENEVLSLDENVNGFLPFQINNPYFSYDSITPRMLMTHTSSIVDLGLYNYVTVGDPTITLEYFLENYLSVGGQYYNNNNFSTHLPGTYYEYSNFGAALNGFLAEALLEEQFKNYAKDSLLTPLEMSNSAWFLGEINLDYLALGYQYTGGHYVPYPNYGHPAYPGLSLKSSSEELAHYTIMLMNKGLYKNEQIMGGPTVDTMCSVQMGLEDNGMGLGLYRTTLHCANEDKTIWGHKGGGTNGYASDFEFCSDQNIAVVYMSNSEQYADEVMVKLFEYASLIVIPDEASNITTASFNANWQMAPDAVEYYLDVASDWQFINFVEGYENLNVGLTTDFNVQGLNSNSNYYYRIKAHNGIEIGPNSSSIHVKTLDVNPGIDENINLISQGSFSYYPNPVKNQLFVSFDINQSVFIKVDILDFTGKQIQKISESYLSTGKHQIRWAMNQFPPGIYFLRLQAGNEVVTKKVVKL